ncbi:MgtC/SapB family protein [uncultured Oscillibacter sp.]|uniref:MgtC/SapB family protein n=1 Tax=uncultured Oscillibacter sp. TaxID=876091 RepID=UPI00272E6549|nr:MgtC/SapB family protein [uncultured Oscillibacter sp.]
MLALFDGLRDVTIWSVALRMTLAVVCGGIIGIEREYKRRPAGFRTHILICLGAAMTTLTSQYLYLVLGQYTDMARLGAQVVAGIGFIGAGTIIVTRRQRVKGLTTAAGLWAAAIIGLALGGGFYEGGLFATLLILIAELFFSRVEYRMLKNAPEVNLYVEYNDNRTMDVLLQEFREHGLKILNMGIIHSKSNEEHNACAIFTLRLHKGLDVEQLQQGIQATAGVVSVREL